MQHIKDVIQDTTVPSWINSVPYNYGEAKAGTMKADEWRNLSTIFLPLALISMWGIGSQHSSNEDAIQLCQILDHTMLLVSAISLACMRTMTKACSNAYIECMTEYLKQLPMLHPGARFKPNHHMSMHLPFFFQLFSPA